MDNSGTLPTNIMHFARLLRRAGLPVGPADMLAAQQAASLIDIGDKIQMRTALRATLIHRHEHEDLFEHAFSLYWRDPEAARYAQAMAAIDGQKEPPPDKAPPGARRIQEAFRAPKEQRKPRDDEPPEIEAVMTVSDRERLQTMDFEAMSAAEIANAKAEIRRLSLPLDAKRTRRMRPDPAGSRTDLRATLRNSLRQGGELIEIARSRRVTRPPPLVVLCDISGSMSRYAQILLHFLHAVANDRDRVSTFLFGTRLSNITRQLRARENMERLHKSCSRLVWLNPLLRWDGFAPKSQGIRAMLPHVDEFRTIHNLASLRSLVESLSRASSPREMDRWRNAA
jgi:uncharacterized protein with von Willebrand factor type A (vWA) domain